MKEINISNARLPTKKDTVQRCSSLLAFTSTVQNVWKLRMWLHLLKDIADARSWRVNKNILMGVGSTFAEIHLFEFSEL